MRSRKSNWTTLIVLIFLMVPITGFAQVRLDRDRGQYELARQYEAMGEIERALNIYISLYQKSPKNFTYFDAVSRCYSNLKRYDELIALIEERLQMQPGNIQFQLRLGEAYLRKGDEQRAFQIWERLLKQYPRNVSVYRLVANTLLQNRLYDRSIEIYLRGRRTIGKSDLFALELAQLHTYRLNYEGATEEYLRFLLANPRQLSYVESRLAQFSGEHSTYEQVTDVLRRWIRKYPQNIGFRKILISTLISFEDFEGAYGEVRALEELKKKTKTKEPPGYELFQFGKTCFTEGQYALAEKAFAEVLRKFPQYPERGRVEYELARTQYRQGNYRQALRLFDRVRKQYPRTSWALEAYLTRGEIFLDRLFAPDSAASSYQQILYEFKQNKYRVRALLALGDVEMVRGNLDRAENYYRQALQLPLSNARQSYRRRLEARIRLAEALFYKKDFAGAQEQLKAILESSSGNLNNEYINDALELSLLIENNLEDARPALELFAEGMKLERARKWEQAEKKFADVAARFPGSDLAPRAIFRQAELKARTGDYLTAVLLFQSLINRYPQNTLCDLSLWKMGQIYEKELRDPARAIEQYETLLLQYPDSMFIEKARKRIRSLEGKP